MAADCIRHDVFGYFVVNDIFVVLVDLDDLFNGSFDVEREEISYFFVFHGFPHQNIFGR